MRRSYFTFTCVVYFKNYFSLNAYTPIAGRQLRLSPINSDSFRISQFPLETKNEYFVNLNYSDFSIVFDVLGEPVPLARHRAVGKIMYNPSAKLMKEFLNACKCHLPQTPLKGPINITLIFYFSSPKNHYRCGKYSSLLKQNAPIWHTNRKDLDNLIKFVLDSLNNVAYVDDSQVVSIRSLKLYTNEFPRVFVGINEIKSPVE